MVVYVCTYVRSFVIYCCFAVDIFFFCYVFAFLCSVSRFCIFFFFLVFPLLTFFFLLFVGWLFGLFVCRNVVSCARAVSCLLLPFFFSSSFFFLSLIFERRPSPPADLRTDQARPDLPHHGPGRAAPTRQRCPSRRLHLRRRRGRR